MILGLSLLPWCAAGQATGGPPEFEVASIKPVDGSNDLGAMGDSFAALLPGMWEVEANSRIPMPDPGRVRIRNINLRGLIAMAYGIASTQVQGPAWMQEKHFAVEAKVPPGMARGDVRPMLQALVEERFGVAVHREPKEVSGYALVVGKSGAKLTPSDTTDEAEEIRNQGKSREEIIADLQKQSKERARDMAKSIHGPGSVFTLSHTSLEGVAWRLSLRVHSPVINMTGIEGSYDVRFEMPAGDTIFDAVERLGLKLVPKKLTVEALVVDHVEREPTAN